MPDSHHHHHHHHHARQPSQLLQRRLNSADTAGLMDTFSMAFRPDAAPITASISLAAAAADPQDRPKFVVSFPAAAPPRESFDSSAGATHHHHHHHHHLHGLAAAPPQQPFSNAYNMAASFTNASFGSLVWPGPSAVSNQAMHQPPTGHVVLSRNESYSSDASSEQYIKSEDAHAADGNHPSTSTAANNTPARVADDKPAVFSTEIDVLMRAIQAKSNTGPDPIPTESSQQPHLASNPAPSAPAALIPYAAPAPSAPSASPTPKKRYLCTIPNCGKAFHQKTHLEIHTRAHTGIKPFVCKEPSCGQRFSQLGNLKTHERRHTGERPYQCDICGKTFAQHGNVRAHKIVHSAAKPFTCRLDNCNKQFTQLGNLKSHQNKFHVDTIRRLQLRFGNIREGDVVDHWEKEMWEYFLSLYRNCNKGIKGRGKDRRIGAARSNSDSSVSSAASVTTAASEGSSVAPPSASSSGSVSSASSVSPGGEALKFAPPLNRPTDGLNPLPPFRPELFASPPQSQMSLQQTQAQNQQHQHQQHQHQQHQQHQHQQHQQHHQPQHQHHHHQPPMLASHHHHQAQHQHHRSLSLPHVQHTQMLPQGMY